MDSGAGRPVRDRHRDVHRLSQERRADGGDHQRGDLTPTDADRIVDHAISRGLEIHGRAPFRQARYPCASSLRSRMINGSIPAGDTATPFAFTLDETTRSRV
ncbi:hypothetical protein [Herbidospora daliensis]|uniref:hypothetical protein n=1 Tax=Herbidospora daliensis TaxID=295585 RepID=UPI000781DBAE|nr:hypothetical protein [Herbidospora daliensis]